MSKRKFIFLVIEIKAVSFTNCVLVYLIPFEEDISFIQKWRKKNPRTEGAFKNYVDRKGWVGGQSNVYACKVNDLFIFTFLYLQGVGWWSKKSKILSM